MSGTRDNEDVDVGKKILMACPGYCGGLGGGKPPPPTVPPMRHAGALTCSEWEAPCHRPVRQGVGKDTNAADRGGNTGELGEGLSVIW